MKAYSAEVQTVIQAPLNQAFRTIVPISLPLIFKGSWPLPAVVGTRDQTGGWDAAGQTRTILLADGSQVREEVTEYTFPSGFAYTVGRFTGPLRHLTREAHGQWWFEPSINKKSTAVRWRYEFIGKSRLTNPLLCFITGTFWRRYMKQALGLSKLEAERAA